MGRLEDDEEKASSSSSGGGGGEDDDDDAGGAMELNGSVSWWRYIPESERLPVDAAAPCLVHLMKKYQK